MNHTIVTPGHKWIPAAKVIAETPTNGDSSISGFYTRSAAGVRFHDLKGELFAFLVTNRHGIFFVTAQTRPEGVWYMQSTTTETERKLGIEGLGYRAQKELEQRITKDLDTSRAASILAKNGVSFDEFVAMANQEPTSAVALQAFFNAGMTAQLEGIEQDGYLLATSLGRSMLYDAGYDNCQGSYLKAQTAA